MLSFQTYILRTRRQALHSSQSSFQIYILHLRHLAKNELNTKFSGIYTTSETSSKIELNEAFNSYAKLSASNVFEADNTFKTGINVGLRNTRASKSIVAGEDVHS